MYIQCPFCHKNYKTKVPKGGNGSDEVIREHKRDIGDPRFIGGGNIIMKRNMQRCPGSGMFVSDIIAKVEAAHELDPHPL